MHNAKGMFRLDRSKGVLKPATSDTKEIYPTRCIRMYIYISLSLSSRQSHMTSLYAEAGIIRNTDFKIQCWAPHLWWAPPIPITRLQKRRQTHLSIMKIDKWHGHKFRAPKCIWSWLVSIRSCAPICSSPTHLDEMRLKTGDPENGWT